MLFSFSFSYAEDEVPSAGETPLVDEIPSTKVSATPSTFEVREIRITGNTVIKETELKSLVASYEGKEITLEEIEKGVELIQTYYRDRGYILAQVYLPAQEIDSGIVRIDILEGRIGTIQIEGNRSYSTPFIQNRLWVGLPGGIFRQAPFQKSLLLLNELTDLTVEPVLQPGSEQGTADLVVKVKDQFPAHVDLDYDNFGSRSSGKERVSLSGSLGNLGANSDHFSALVVFPVSPFKADHPFYQLGYSFPINRLGSQVAFSYSNSVFRAGGEFEVLDIRGEGEVWSVSATHPLRRTTTGGSDFSVGITGKSSKNQILGIPSNHDELRVLNLGYKINGLRGLTSRYFFNVNMIQGLGENFGGMDDHFELASRPGGDNSFTKMTMDTAYIKQFSPRYLLVLRGALQRASQTLVAMEQYTVGGPGTVRGFSQSAVSGDHGYMVSTELKATLLEWRSNTFSWVFFLEHGAALLDDPSAEEHLTGGGTGLRAALSQWGMAQIDIAFPIDPDKNSENKSYILYGQLSIHF